MQNFWYAVYTAPRAEKQVAQRLDRYGVETYLPMLSVQRMWSDRVKVVETPLFSSYVFVHCRPTDIIGLLKISGLVKVVYYDNEPAVVKDSEIRQIKEFVMAAKTCSIEDGDRVEILCGTFRNVTGKVIKIGKTHLYLCLEQLGAHICVRRETVRQTKSSAIGKKEPCVGIW